MGGRGVAPWPGGRGTGSDSHRCQPALRAEWREGGRGAEWVEIGRLVSTDLKGMWADCALTLCGPASAGRCALALGARGCSVVAGPGSQRL